MLYYFEALFVTANYSRGKASGMKAVVSVTGKDRTGIIAAIAGELAACKINVLDISQTILHGNFVMIMHVDASDATVELGALGDRLQAAVKDWDIIVHVQHEDLFTSMHRV